MWSLANTALKDRAKTGDHLGGRVSNSLQRSEKVFPCFRSLLPGDHLGVEVALSGHAAMLLDVGLLKAGTRLQGGHTFPPGPEYEGLVIDDYFALSVMPASSSPASSLAVKKLEVAAKVGAEIDTSKRVVALGRAIVGAPLQKRIAMTVLSMRLAQLPVISSDLAARVAGSWTSIFMYRRCLACVIDDLFKIGSGVTGRLNDVYALARKAAEELVLASILSFVAISDVAARYSNDVYVYATDASLAKGAVCVRKVQTDVACALWLGGDKKGAYTKLDPPLRELCQVAGLDDYVEEVEKVSLRERKTSVPKRLEFSFDFLEVCAGAGSVSKALAELGFTVCTPIELSNSRHFDVTSIELIDWICCMIRTKRIRAIMVEPVCTTFSAAAHPALRSYAQPRGFDPKCPRTALGNAIAFRCLFLLWYASLWNCPALGEQPRLSKMAWLSVWRFLISQHGFSEAIVASCQFGSPHRKEFRMIGKGLDMQHLQVKCPGGHPHIRIEGAYAKPSAVYTPALAEHVAKAFAVALRRKYHAESSEVDVRGLESVIANNLFSTGDWKVVEAWPWRKPMHINVLESCAYLKVLRLELEKGGDVRFTSLLDSTVAKCSHAKGRSSSRALTPALKRGAALQIAGGLYPALGYAPTRLNTADASTRDRELPDTHEISLSDLLDFNELQSLHSIALSKAAAGWVRLVVLLSLVTHVSSSETQPCDAAWQSPATIKDPLSSFFSFPDQLDFADFIGLWNCALSVILCGSLGI